MRAARARLRSGRRGKEQQRNRSLHDIFSRSDMDLPGFSVSVPEYELGEPCAVVSLAGAAGVGDAAWFHQLLELHAARGPERIVIDLSRLSSMDWWAALILPWVGRVVSRRGGTLVLASPQPAVARLLQAAGVTRVMAVYQSVEQAHGSMPGTAALCRGTECGSLGRISAERRDRREATLDMALVLRQRPRGSRPCWSGRTGSASGRCRPLPGDHRHRVSLTFSGPC